MMKRRFTILTAAFALLAFLAIPLGMRGQSATFTPDDFSGQGTSGSGSAISATVDGVTFACDKGYGTTEIRCYSGGTVTISSSNTITELAFTFSGGRTGGLEESYSNLSTTSWEETLTSQARFTEIVVTYTDGGGNQTTYTVTYHANVAGVTDVVDTYNEGATITLRSANTFTYEGYTFEVWNTDANGDGDAYEAGDQIEDINEDLEFYAIWTENVTPEGEETATLTATNLELTGSYTTNTEKTIDGITYVYTDLMKNNNNIQAKANSGTIKNSTAYPGDIISVAITHSGTARTTTINGSADGTNWTQIATGSGSITADFSGLGYKYFQITRGANAAYWTQVEIIYSTDGGSSLEQSDLAITNTSTALSFDLYNNAEPQVITYSTSSTGEITITPASPTSYFSYVHDATAKTITVTPLAVTPSAQTINISQEADDNYYAGTATFTVSVANSDPNIPGTENNPYTVAQARAAIDAGTGVTDVYATGIVSAIPTAYNSTYSNITFNMVDEEGDEIFLQAYRCGGEEAANVAVGDVVVVYGNLIKYNTTYEFGQGCQIVTLTHPVIATPTVTVAPATINAPAEGADGSLAITYENIPDLISFDYYFCDAEGNELEGDGPEWIYSEINEGTEGYTVNYIIEENDGEARTAYFKVYTFVENGDDLEEVYAIVTVNQEEYVAPTYAELPFEFNGGRADIENTDGLYQDGLGTDYNASTNPNTQLKFDGTGDWLMLQFNERPGTLTFDIKGNSFSGGTFTVQTSEDGETYEDLVAYTELGEADTQTFDDLGENVRYIKWIYTNKGTGNVGLGNINLSEYVAPTPTIIVESTTITATAEETSGTLNVTYTAIETSLGASIYWYTDNTGTTTIDEPSWISADVNETSLNVDYVIADNNGEARSAYFKVYGVGTDENDVYSELVTINQAAAPQQYTLTVEPFENLELITFVNDEMVMEADGEIQVNEGDQIMLSIVADEGYVIETLMVNGVDHAVDIAEDFTYAFEMPAENVTISATASEIPTPVAGSWVLTSLADLTEDDIFVIVGDNGDTYAMSNNNGTGSAPAAVEVTVDNEALSEEPAANLQWTLGIIDDGYNFFPNGTTETWLYCTNSNNGVRVGTNTNNAFTISEEGYLVNDATGRYIGIYNSQDWRCYTSINTNIEGQTFAFYKRVVAPETYNLTINGYNDDDVKDGYNLIASPVYVNPANVEGMTEGIFDLYYFDQSQELEWQNYEFSTFNLVPGKGYLYAKKGNETYNFTLTGTPYTGDGVIELNYTEDAEWAGWNLVGNPFGNSAQINVDYYEMNTDGSELIANEDFIVDAMQGVFVIAENSESTVSFIENAQLVDLDAKMVLNVMKNRGNVIDRAVVRFGEGRQLPKFQLDPNSTKLYIPQGGQDFAVVRSANEGEMPVNFKAETRGTYTLNVEANMEMTYLHLIDNLTGADIDLLANPSYSFEANTNDYTSRFKLIFRASMGIEENNATETFAYFNGSEWVISNTGDATLQVIDMMGRVLRSEQINGNTAVNINETAGIYMLRLVNGENVMVQKVVVK